MPRMTRLLLIIFTNCVLLDLVYGLIGEWVRRASVNEFPFAVSIAAKPTITVTNPKYVANLHICTGAVVSRKSVLTVAHCLLNRHPHQIEIIAGSVNVMTGQKYYPESWITFDEWHSLEPAKYPQNDIALITMHGGGFTHPEVAPIALSPIEHKNLTNQLIKIMGWGVTVHNKIPTRLKVAVLHVVTNQECSHQGTMLKGTNFNVPANYFCSKAEPWILSTLGDGGAPIVDQHLQLVGINIGPCPKVVNYPEDMLHELLRNCHLNLHYYKDFLKYNIRHH